MKIGGGGGGGGLKILISNFASLSQRTALKTKKINEEANFIWRIYNLRPISKILLPRFNRSSNWMIYIIRRFKNSFSLDSVDRSK